MTNSLRLGDYKLDKSYKLCSKRVIDDLFVSGTTVKTYPYIAIIKPVELSNKRSFNIVFSAPKRTFKKAYQRNRIKRICKEAVRLNKSILENYLTENGIQLAVFLVYSAKEELDHQQLNKKTIKLFNEITTTLHAKK